MFSGCCFVLLLCWCFVCLLWKESEERGKHAGCGGHRAVQGALGAVGSGGVCCAVAMETVMCTGQGNCRAQQRRAEPSPGKGL